VKVEGRALLPGSSFDYPPDGSEQTANCRAFGIRSAVVCTARGGEGGERRSHRRGGAVLSRKCAESWMAYRWHIELAAVRWPHRHQETRVSAGIAEAKPSDGSSRHRALRRHLDWELRLLSDIERIIFRRIALFVATSPWRPAQRIAAEPGSGGSAVADVIAGLFEKSLLRPGFCRGQPRYRLLNTTRAICTWELEEHGEGRFNFCTARGICRP